MSKTKEQISHNMKQIKGKDTKIELILRKALWSKGLHYQKNVSTIYGKPDIVFKQKKVAIFCDSEFWHGHNWEINKYNIKSNKDYWYAKIERNIKRDEEVNKKLKELGWTVLRFWGKDIIKNTDQCVKIVGKELKKA